MDNAKSSRSKLIAPNVFQKRLEKEAQAKANRPIKIVFSIIGVIFVLGLISVYLISVYNADTSAKNKAETERLLGHSLPTAADNNQLEQKRISFAKGLETMFSHDSPIKNVRAETIGSDNSILLITADDITAGDCSQLRDNEFVQSGKLANFKGISCKNRISGATWDLNF